MFRNSEERKVVDHCGSRGDSQRAPTFHSHLFAFYLSGLGSQDRLLFLYHIFFYVHTLFSFLLVVPFLFLSVDFYCRVRWTLAFHERTFQHRFFSLSSHHPFSCCFYTQIVSRHDPKTDRPTYRPTLRILPTALNVTLFFFLRSSPQS